VNTLRYLVLGLLLSANSCGDADEGPICAHDCDSCTKTTCPPDRCGVLVVLLPDCKNLAPSVEVAMEQCLESKSLTPGTSMQLCSTVPALESRTVTARGDDWIWQRKITCEDDKVGRIVIVSLSCADDLPQIEEVLEQ